MWNSYESIGVLSECDLCHDYYSPSSLKLVGQQFLCLKCCGDVTQESEYCLDKARVGGANPSITTNL